MRLAPLVLAVLAVACWAPDAALAQCSMCKEALAGNAPEAQGLAEGMFWSIVLLLSLPFGLTCGIVGMIVRSDRRRAEHEGKRP